jgi:hypothetical protein
MDQVAAADGAALKGAEQRLDDLLHPASPLAPQFIRPRCQVLVPAPIFHSGLACHLFTLETAPNRANMAVNAA